MKTNKKLRETNFASPLLLNNGFIDIDTIDTAKQSILSFYFCISNRVLTRAHK